MYKQAKIVICSGNKDKSKPELKSVNLGDIFDDEDEFRSALHEVLDDELDCLLERLAKKEGKNDRK